MRKLYAFDFDDTLARTTNVLHVRKSDGRTITLTSEEYPSYVKEEGDVFDFADFRMPRDAEKIEETVRLLLSAIEEHGIDSVVILTARTTDAPVRHFLEQHDLPPVQIMPVGREGSHSHPEDKAVWLRWVIEKCGITEVFFYDDHPGNVLAVSKIEHPKAKVKTHLIKTKSPT